DTGEKHSARDDGELDQDDGELRRDDGRCQRLRDQLKRAPRLGDWERGARERARGAPEAAAGTFIFRTRRSMESERVGRRAPRALHRFGEQENRRMRLVPPVASALSLAALIFAAPSAHATLAKR